MLPPPPPQARPALPTAPLTLNGSGTAKTAPFSLAAGSYKLNWTCTTAESSANCIAYLQSVARSRFSETSPDESELLFNELPKRGNTRTGETFAYRIKGGEYYISSAAARAGR